MTRRAELQKLLRQANRTLSYQKLGKLIGISHTTVGDFLKEPDKADDRTVSLIELWAAGTPVGKAHAAPASPSDRQKAAAFDAIVGIVALTLQPESDADALAQRLEPHAANFLRLLREWRDLPGGGRPNNGGVG